MRAAGALALVAACASVSAQAQTLWPSERPPPHEPSAHPRSNPHFHPLEPVEPQLPARGPGGDGFDFDEQRRTDGHLTPEERRLLRQHIEDAVHELYGH